MQKKLYTLFGLLAIFSLIAVAPSAFAEHGEGGMAATVTNAPGSATPGCEATDDCFIPSTVTIHPGGSVTWENTDNAAHTATSGSPTDGPDGVWDSSLMMVGGSYSTTLDDEGTYPYFCMVHPWMSGTIIVEEEDDHSDEHAEEMGHMEEKGHDEMEEMGHGDDHGGVDNIQDQFTASVTSVSYTHLRAHET